MKDSPSAAAIGAGRAHSDPWLMLAERRRLVEDILGRPLGVRIHNMNAFALLPRTVVDPQVPGHLRIGLPVPNTSRTHPARRPRRTSAYGHTSPLLTRHDVSARRGKPV
jgi:hypothetical protein